MARPNPQPASTEWEKGPKLNHQQAPNGGKKLFGARKVFFRLAGLLVVGKNFSGPKKFLFPIQCLRTPNLQYSLCCPFKFPRSCAQRQPPSKRMCSFAAAVLCKATLPQGVTNYKCAWQSACAVTNTNPSSPLLEELAKYTRETFVSLSSHKTKMPSHALKYHRPWRMSA